MSSTAKPRGPYKAGVIRRRQIIEAATVAFARRGYTGASLREIADEVGVTVPGLLRHFASKEELLTAVLDKWDEDTIKLFQQHAEGLEWYLQYPDVMRYHEEHPGLVELYLTICGEATDPAHPARPWVAARFDTIVRDASRHLRIAQARGEVKPMSDQEMEREIRGLFGLMDGLELQWINKPELGLATTFEAIFAFILERWRPPTPAETTPEAPPALKAKSAPVPRVLKNRSQRIVKSGTPR